MVKKTENIFNVNDEAKKLFQLIYGKKKAAEEKKFDDETPRINVSRIVSRLSFLYEKIRVAVDYDEDHLLRKNAIKRILKRLITIEGALKDYDKEEISRQLLTELIQAGYLPNNKIPEIKIGEVGDLLEKYIKLREHFKKTHPITIESKSEESKERNHILSWIVGLAATEIEENLNKDEVKQMIVANMFDILSKIIKLPPDLPHQKDLEIQIYLSIGRTYLKFDDDMLNFAAFKYYHKWQSISDEEIFSVAQDLKAINLAVGKQLKHPLIKQIDKIVRRYALYFSILQEMIEDNPAKAYENAISNAKNFRTQIKEKCDKKYSKVKSRLWRSGLRSIIYIFLTKGIFVILLEIPAIKFFGEIVNPVTLAINVSFPAILLFIIILFTKTPGAENTKRIIEGIEEICYVENKRKQPIFLRRTTKRNYFMNILFNLLYATTFLISIIFLIKLLVYFNFNWVSITIFLFFLSFVSFFSFRIKRDVKQYIITEEKETILGFIFDFFYMPIVAVGKLLSDNVSKINVFIFVLDFIIETPFKVIIGIIEDWTKYLKEKKEDLSS